MLSTSFAMPGNFGESQFFGGHGQFMPFGGQFGPSMGFSQPSMPFNGNGAWGPSGSSSFFGGEFSPMGSGGSFNPGLMSGTGFCSPTSGFGPGSSSFGPQMGGFGPGSSSFGPQMGGFGPGSSSFGPQLGGFGPGSSNFGSQMGGFGSWGSNFGGSSQTPANVRYNDNDTETIIEFSVPGMNMEESTISIFGGEMRVRMGGSHSSGTFYSLPIPGYGDVSRIQASASSETLRITVPTQKEIANTVRKIKPTRMK